MKWQNLEERIRLFASCKWASPAVAEHINGVDVDCVVKPQTDRWILVEITKENSLAKLREDLAKFAAIRPHLFHKNIYSECYFVCENDPPRSLIETGSGQNVNVLSAANFEKHFLDYECYRHLRNKRKFGSAVDPESGDSDPRQYVDVSYEGLSDGRSYGAPEIVDLIKKGKKIILLGNYGTGKSRCIREIFRLLSDRSSSNLLYPVAIDLRDQWGMKRAHEILQRHFDDLGASALTDGFMRILDHEILCPLIDGFDEIGSQTWSDDPKRLTTIRSESLQGVRDLLAKKIAGAIITGREHYFNSDEEMFKCLGLDQGDMVLLRCADEFSESEMQAYLGKSGLSVNLPPWVPRRPLVCQLVAGMSQSELNSLAMSHTGEAAFWQVFITALCERERRIHNALDPVTIRRLLRRLARVTRDKARDVGPITVEEMGDAFMAETGMHPVDESAVMLQRLSSLGRVSAETSDRCFVDQYILDGLRAEDVINLDDVEVVSLINKKWINPLKRLGLTLLSADMQTVVHATNYHRLLKSASQRMNSVLAGDIAASMLLSSDDAHEFDRIEIKNSHISYLDLSGKFVSGLQITSSIIDVADIAESRTHDVQIQDCLIQQVAGVSAAGGLPSWITNCDVITYESVSTVARIRRAELSEEQRVFVTIISKLFFQPGSGRQEGALLRGLGEAGKKKSAEKIINRLRTQEIIERFGGKDGWVYTPIRKHSSRMGRILMELSLSNDPLWLELRK